MNTHSELKLEVKMINSFTAMHIVAGELQLLRDRGTPIVCTDNETSWFSFGSPWKGRTIHVVLRDNMVKTTYPKYYRDHEMSEINGYDLFAFDCMETFEFRIYEFGECMSAMLNRWGFNRDSMTRVLVETDLSPAYYDEVEYLSKFDRMVVDLEQFMRSGTTKCWSGVTRNGCKYVGCIDPRNSHTKHIFNFGSRLMMKEVSQSHRIVYQEFTTNSAVAVTWFTGMKF